MDIDKIQPINSLTARLIVIRNRPVMLDRDVAAIYGIETRVMNQAVKRNANKFPQSYRFALNATEFQELITNCDRFKTLKHSSATTYAFTEKGLYMLATILKSPIALETTFEIIETFAKVRELKSNLLSLHNEQDPEKQTAKMTRFSEIISEVVMPELQPEETETTLELNFLIGKLKHTVKRKRRDNGPDIVEEPETPYGDIDYEPIG